MAFGLPCSAPRREFQVIKLYSKISKNLSLGHLTSRTQCSVEKQEVILTEKKIREICSLVICLVKTLLLRNLLKRLNESNFLSRIVLPAVSKFLVYRKI